jgi:hypothetical protein
MNLFPLAVIAFHYFKEPESVSGVKIQFVVKLKVLKIILRQEPKKYGIVALLNRVKRIPPLLLWI